MSTKVADFTGSFYGPWFQHLPDQLILGAMGEVELESSGLKSRCPKLYAEYVRIKTAMFLLAFTDVGNIEIEIDGEKLPLKSLSDSGAVAYVKKDSVDSSISREYHKPVIPEGMTAEDFPLGRIKARIACIEKACNTLLIRKTGFNSGMSNCGMERRRIFKNASASSDYKCT